MWREFKTFALKGNVLDLAVGVIIGAAFGKIVSSLVNDIIMPLLGVLLGGKNLTELEFTFHDAVVKYGLFLQTVIDFFIIAFSIFLFIKVVTRFKRKEVARPAEPAAALPVPTAEEKLLIEIRDLLKQR